VGCASVMMYSKLETGIERCSTMGYIFPDHGLMLTSTEKLVRCPILIGTGSPLSSAS